MGEAKEKPIMELRAGRLRCELHPELGGAIAGLGLAILQPGESLMAQMRIEAEAAP
jgi:hypothetical protein